MKSAFGSFAFFILAIAIAGCGSNLPATHATSGKLLWEDGKPVAGANIRFEPVEVNAGRTATGFTGKDGAFAMSTFTTNDGVMSGNYVVVVTKTEAVSDASAELKADPGDPKSMINAMKKHKDATATKKKISDPVPAAYGSVKTSSLKWKVDGPNPNIEIKLKRI